MLKGNAIIAQSGGPTAVINNSVCGVVERWLSVDAPGKIYAGLHGIKGILDENIIDMSKQDKAIIHGLRYTPGAGIFSCRYKVTDSDQEKLVEICKKYDIRYFFYNGGNDSMDTAHKMMLAAEAAGYEMYVIGVPKTVDNDLPFTDHCPGFGSAAKYLAATVMETGIDLQSVSTKNKVTILEAMGRNAGWLTAAGALAKRRPEDAPHLVYLPEVPFYIDKFLADVEKLYNELGYAYVVASEGIVDDKGNYIAAGGTIDAFGHAQLSGAGEALKNIVEHELGIKARCNTLGTAQRSAMHFASLTDVNEAYMSGAKAVDLALAGVSGVMVSLECKREPEYVCRTGTVPLGKVANIEKKVPLDWIVKEGNNVTKDFIKYARPLIMGEVNLPIKDGLPDYVHIDPKIGKIK
ncbi:MAG: 6-phosphofructokinase [Clostridia bacterium]|nr:6-phosphofructokinase [Clostridia bacterium]MDD4571830.1 6-phosphofructokinase [Clostridia bacterium]